MNPHSLETEYESFSASMQARANGLTAQWPSFQGFWERWCKEHRIMAHTLSARDVISQVAQGSEPVWKDFLQRRQRMVSALGQGLKQSDTHSTPLREELAAFLREHDLGFMALLQKELERVKEQMTHAFTVRKTVNAYAQTAQYRRE
jgi:hypothetical protein